MTTLQEAVSQKFGDSAWKLLSGSDEAAAVRKSIGYGIAGGDQIITDMPFQQIEMVISSSTFADDDEECVYVARMVFWMIDKPDVLPMVSCHHGFDLGARCLMSLSLYKKAMARRTKFRGCPSPDFYREIGIKTVSADGMESVANHFDDWASLVGETLCG